MRDGDCDDGSLGDEDMLEVTNTLPSFAGGEVNDRGFIKLTGTPFYLLNS